MTGEISSPFNDNSSSFTILFEAELVYESDGLISNLIDCRGSELWSIVEVGHGRHMLGKGPSGRPTLLVPTSPTLSLPVYPAR